MSGGVGDLDPIGAKALAETVKLVTARTLDGAEGLLSRICLPAAAEFGLLLKDSVHGWRVANLEAIAAKAEARHKLRDANIGMPPRLAFKIMEEGSWIDDELIQEMWAGLLASSCTPEGVDDSNLIFIDLLAELTSAQVRLLNRLCNHANKMVTDIGIVTVMNYQISLDDLQQVTGVDDIHRLDREIDHLRKNWLVHGGLSLTRECAMQYITPSDLAIQLYVRTQGSRENPVEFFNLEETHPIAPAVP